MRASAFTAATSTAAIALCSGVSGFVFAPPLSAKRAGVPTTGKASPCASTAPRQRWTSALKMAAEEFDGDAVMASAEERMDKSVESVRLNLETLRTGRANPKILDRVVVECYGAETPLNQVASVKTTSATALLVESYDPTILADIAAAIQEADLGLTPNNDGTVIRLNMPPVTEDRRKELAKEAKGLGEEGKVAIRNIRREAVDTVKKAEKAKSLGKDQSKDAQDAIQKLTDKTTKTIDEKVAAKEKDILKV
ncbi:unnamed protein product [Ectocarpus sp. 4 AP-2014]